MTAIPRLWLMPLALAVAVLVGSLVQFPLSLVVVVGGVGGLLLLWWKPWLGFCLLVVSEVVCTEDRLLYTENLARTPYYETLPYFGGNLYELALLGLLATVLVRNRWRIVRSRLDVPVLALATTVTLGMIIGGLTSGDWTRAYEPRRLAHFFAAYILVTNLIDDRRKLTALLVLYLAATGLKGVQGMWLYSQGEGLVVKWNMRAIFTGWGDGLNFTAYLLVVSAFWFRRVRLPGQALWWLLSVPVLFSFLMSYKRAFYVALVGGLLVLFVLFDAAARRRMIFYGGLALTAMLAVLVASGKWGAFSARILSIFEPKKESSANYRLVEWQNALISIRQHPWLGIGLGGILAMVLFLPRTNLLGVHNTFLWSATKMGVPGLFCILWLLIAMLGSALRHRRRAEGRDRVVAECLIAILCAFTAAAMFAPMLHQMRTSFWLGCLAGVISIFERTTAQQQNRTASPPPEPSSSP